MININFEKFSTFYHNNIEPQLIDLEKERKKCILSFRILDFIYILFIILFIGFPIFPIFLPFDSFLINHYEIVVFSIFIPIIIGFPLYIYSQQKQKQYIRKLKLKVYTKLFKIIGLEYKQGAFPEFADYQNAVLNYCQNNEFLEVFYIMHFEDGISGIFMNIPFAFADTGIIKKWVDNKHDSTIFKGLMLAVKLNKNFDKETVIKTDNFKLFDIKKNIIKLEDEEFNKKFKVLADDEVEARYLLTTSFMERLKNFHKNKKDKTIIFFDNKCSESKNMFILTNTGKDNFEIPLNKTLLNEKIYYNLLKELVDMLEIAVALKLEQNIGL